MEQWTDERLNKLANTVERLAEQMQQMHQRIDQLGDQIEQTCSNADSLMTAISTQPMLVETTYLDDSSDSPSVDWVARLATVEQQMQQLTEQIKHLERRLTANFNPSNLNLANFNRSVPTAPFAEDDVDDEPDEVLWDFIEPTSNS
jgi:chaperonin cofactor prefoldin